MVVKHKKTLSFLAALAGGILCTQIPLIRNFHFESAILASLIGAYWAGFRAASNRQNPSDLYHVALVLSHLYTASLPLILLALTSNCFSWHGLGFWIIYPGPSVLLGAAIGRLVRSYHLPKAAFLTFLILTIIGVGALILEFRLLPQVYFFNHVWGGWPGPIYDETVTVSFSAIFYRSLTLAWSALLWFIPTIYQSKYSLWVVAGSLLYLLLGYNNLAEQGIISPEAYIQQRLNGVKTTGHFNIHYANEAYSQQDVERYALLHEFYLHEIMQALEVDDIYRKNKINSYLYADPWQKKELVGAKYTSYVPVWLQQDQLHIAKQQLDNSLKHELVHVVAKQFGNSLFNASWSIGLIEGLAVALAGSDNPMSTTDQLVAGGNRIPDTQQMMNSLSFSGFYGGRSTVNYTTSGSFIQYLLTNYPVSHFKEAYRNGDISKSYPQPPGELVEGWHRHLSQTPVDSIDRSTASNLFSIPSIFEKTCPHTVSDVYHQWDQWQLLITRRDTSKALIHLEKAKKLSRNSTIWNTWARWKLRNGRYTEVHKDTTALKDNPLTSITRADAYFLAGDTTKAFTMKSSASNLPDKNQSYQISNALKGRANNFQWQSRLNIGLKDSIPEAETWDRLNSANQLYLLLQTMQNQRWEEMRRITKLLLQDNLEIPITNNYFNLVEWHITLKNIHLARQMLKKAGNRAQRIKQQQKIDELLALIDYRSINN